MKAKRITLTAVIAAIVLAALAAGCSVPSPTASPLETIEQSTGGGDISDIDPYLACLGASAVDISSSFSSSPYSEWEYGDWDGGSPYFIDGKDGIVYYFSWLEELVDDPLTYLTADAKCVQINFPCSRIYASPSDMDQADLEKLWGQSFDYSYNMEDEIGCLYTVWNEHYEIRIDCTEESRLTENSYICIIDRNLIN